VDSLLAQDTTDYEIILVDDGSTDNSGAVADEIVSETIGYRQWAIDEDTNPQSPIASRPTLRVIHQENMGLSEARNTGTRAAQGEYIMYVDSDDYLQLNVLRTLMAQVECDQLDVLRFRYQNVRESGEVFAPYKDMTNYNDYSSMPTDGLTFLNERMGTQCYAVQFIMRRELALQELFSPGIYFEDTDWTPRMLLHAKRVASTELVVYNYLWREGSITLSQKDITKQRKQLQDKMGLLERLNQWGNTISDRRWFDSMISSLVVNIVGMLAGPFYAERREYIKQIKALGILPITTYRIAPRAKRKVTLINLSIDIATWLLHWRR
jgi:heptose III glucuronosyltransferase